MKTTSNSVIVLFLLLIFFSCKKENFPGNERTYDTTKINEEVPVDCDSFITKSNTSENDEDLLADASFEIEPEINKTPSKVNSFEVDPKTEILTKRDRTSKHYLRKDGKTIDAILSPKSVHYKNDAGAWEDINTALKPSEKKDYIFANTTNNLQSWFPADPTKHGVIIKTAKTDIVMGKNLTLSWVNSNEGIIKSQKFKSANPKIDGNTITYKNALSAIDNQYIILQDQIKHNFVLEEKPIIPEGTDFLFFGEDVKLPKGYRLDFDQNGSGLVVIDDENKIYLEIPAPVVYEEKNEMITADESYASFNIEKLAEGENNYRIITKVSAKWLSERTYPVVVDPTIILNGGSSGYIHYDYYSYYRPTDCGYQNTTDVYFRAYNNTSAIIALNRNYYQSSECSRWWHSTGWSGHYHYYYSNNRYLDYFKSWIKYNTSSISDAATIDAVEFSGNIPGGYSGNLSTTIYSSSTPGDYTTSTNASQYNNVTAYSHGSTIYGATGQYPFVTLNTDANTRLQNLLPSNYFQIGLYSGNTTSNAAQTKVFDTSASTLRVTYTEVCNDITNAPIDPFPYNASANVCYDGGGAVTALGWTAVPEATLYDVYFGTSATPALFESNLTNTATTLNLNLIANTQYYWKVEPKNDCGVYTNVSTWSFTTAQEVCDDVACNFAFNNVSPITEVAFATISNASSGSTSSPSYENFTPISTSVAEGSTQVLRVEANSGTSGTTEERTLYITAFFDWNQNNDFTDAGESYQIGTIYNSNGIDATFIDGTITIPTGNDVTIGNTTMRVIASRYNYNNDPCNPVPNGTDPTYGQTEDYAVNICGLPNAICKAGYTVTLDASGNASIVASDIDNGSTADCGIQSMVISETTFDCSDVGTNAVTLTVTDVYGNESICTAIVTVEDNEAPNAIAQDVTVTLDATGNGTLTAAQVDNGSNDSCGAVSLSIDNANFTCDDIIADLFISEYIEGAGSNRCIEIYNGTGAPVDLAAGNYSLLQYDDGSVTPTATVTLSGVIANGDVYVVCNPNADAEFLAVTNTTANFTYSGNDAIVLDKNGTALDIFGKIGQNPGTFWIQGGNRTFNNTLVRKGNVTAGNIDDATDFPSLATEWIEFPRDTFSDLGSHSSPTVTLTVTDASGNTATATANVTLEDITAPNAVCQAVTVQLDASGNGTLDPADVDNGSTDNCGIASLELSQTVFDCSHIGTNTVTFTVTDINGNESTCNATITVEDNIAPNAIAQDVTVTLDASGNGILTAGQVDNGSNDTCGAVNLSIDNDSFTCADIVPGLITSESFESWEDSSYGTTSNATLASGMWQSNRARTAGTTAYTGTVAVTFARNVATKPYLIYQGLDGNGKDGGLGNISFWYRHFNGDTNTPRFRVQYNQAGAGWTNDVVIDVPSDTNWRKFSWSPNISGDDILVRIFSVDDAERIIFDDFSVSGISSGPTVTLTVTDANGNASTSTANVTVVDNVNPVALAQNVTVQLDANGNGSTTTTLVDNGSNDACGIQSLVLSQTDFDCSHVGGNTVTLTVTDNNGNVSNATANVDVQDNVVPVATAQDVIVQLDASGNGSTTAILVNNGSDDICGIASMTISPSTFTCANIGDNTVTLTVTDNNGNVSTATANADVQDNVAPNALCQNIIVQLDANGEANITTADIDNGSNDNCGIASTSLNTTTFDCSNVGENSVTLTVTDVNGNTSSCNATVTVQDSVVPNAICQNVTVYLDANGQASITPQDIDNGSSDNCGAVTLSLDKTSFDCDDVTIGGGSDSSGCYAIQSFESSGDTWTSLNLSTPPCTNGGDRWDYSNSLSGITPNDGGQFWGIQDLFGSCGGSGFESITLPDYDVSAYSSNVFSFDYYTIGFDDNDDIKYELFYDNISQGEVLVVNGSSNFSTNGWVTETVNIPDNITNVRVVISIRQNGGSDYAGIDNIKLCGESSTSGDSGIPVILTVTDSNGNSSTCTANVTVLDAILPEITCPGDITQDSDLGSCDAIVTYNVTSLDNCAGATVIQTEGLASGSAFPIGTTTNTFEVTDASGNIATCSFNVIIEDNELPIVACQDVTVYLGANGQASITPQDIDNGSTDNCGAVTLSLSQSSFDCNDISNGGSASGVWINEIHYDNAGSDVDEMVEIAGTAGLDLTGYSVVLYNGNGGASYSTINLSGTIDNEGGSGYGAVFFTVSSMQNGAPDGLALVDNLGNVIEFLSYEGSFTATNGPANGLSSDGIGVVESGSTPIGDSLQRTGDGNSSWTGPLTASPGSLNTGQTLAGGGDGVSVILTVTDPNGNVSTCTATVTVLDTVNPVLNCPGDITQNTDVDSCDAVVTYSVTSSDNCSGEILVQTEGLPSGSTFPLGTTTNSFELTDASGNTVSCSFDVIIEDNESPTVVCQDVTVFLDAFGNASISASDIDNGSTDACGIASTSIDVTSFDCSDIGSAPVINELFISEYIEGGGNNKCIEIYNGTGSDINLAANNYRLLVYANGSSSAGSNIALSGTIANGDVYVVCNSSASGAFTSQAEQTSGSVSFNGDDAVALTKGGASIDIFGKIGQDPGSYWSGNGIRTQNRTLVRNANISSGNIDNINGFPSLETEWTEFPQDDASNLGSHSIAGGGIPVTLTVTDNNGNVASCIATVTVMDSIAPEISCVTNDIRNTDLGVCTYTIQGNEFDASFTDNCAAGSITNSLNGTATIAGEVLQKGDTTIIWTVDDGNGQTATCSTTITVEDNEIPVINGTPSNIIVNNDAGNCDAAVTWIAATVADNCPGATISSNYQPGDTFPLGTTTVTYTASDANGNDALATTFTVTVEDNEIPVINGTPSNITVSNDTGNCDAVVTWIAATVADNCPGATISSNYQSGDAFPLGTTTVTYTASDANGNDAVATTFTVTVEDNEIPVINGTPSNITVSNDTGNCDAVVTWIAATVADNCTGATISSDYQSGDTFPLGTTTVTYIASDANGNAAVETSFTITVEDNENPVIACIENDMRDTDLGECTYTIQGNEFDATFTDNCTSGTITNSLNGTSSIAGEILNQGDTMVTWTVEDGNGQSATCTTTITVEDNEAPIVDCINLQVILDANGNGGITIADINNNSTDNCEIASITLSQTTFDCSDIGGDLDALIISEYIDGSGDDDCIEIFNGTGNPINLYEENYTVSFYYNGSATPSATIPLLGVIADRDVYVICNPFGPGAMQADQTGGFAFDGNDAVALIKDGNAVDILGEIGVNPGSGWNIGSNSTLGTTLVRNADVLQGNINAVSGIGSEWTMYTQNTFSYLGSHEIEITDLANNVILTVTDTSGNVSTCEGNVTVIDDTLPIAQCQNVIVQLDENGVGSITASAVDNGSYDACGIKSLSLNETDFDCSNIGDNTVTLTVTDNNGNTATCTATVTVIDEVVPVVNCQPLVVQLDANGNVTIAEDAVNDGSTDACGGLTYDTDITSFDCSNVGDNTVTLTVTDVNGNSSQCTTTVTVEDNVSPNAECQAITVQLNANGTATISGTDVDNGSNDNCEIASYEVFPNTFTCDNIGVNTVTLTVTDNNGNVSTCSTTVTVEGDIPTVTITEGELPEFCQGAALVLTANGDFNASYLWDSGEVTPSIEVTGNGTYGVTVTSATNCEAYASYTVTGFDPGSLIAAYTILASDEVYLHGGNLVQSGGVGAMNQNTGNIKLHQATNIVGFAQAPTITLNQGSTVGSSIYAPANPTIPAFIYNTYSNNSSPDATINNNQTITLSGSVYDVVTVKQNATVIFSQSNVYINEIKTFNGASIEFTNCANVMVNEKFMLAQNGTINSYGNKVVFYVNEDVQIEKGSNVRASIHAYNHEIMAKGNNSNGNNAGEPTYMTGLFIANKVHGNKNVIWNADDLCSPCPVTAPIIENNEQVDIEEQSLKIDFNIDVWPVPSDTKFNLRLNTVNETDRVEIFVFDMNNRLVHQGEFHPTEVYKFGNNLEGGGYIVKVSQAGKKVYTKVVKF